MDKRLMKKIFVFSIFFIFCNISILSPLSNADNIEETKDIINIKTTDLKTSLNNEIIDQKISFFMKFARFPSLSAGIINDNEIVWSKGYGYYDLSEKKEPTSDTIYLIASITKTIVGTALMQQYEKGLFDLDEDVNNYLPFILRNPHFPDDPISFRMLLSHTSSLNMNTRDVYYLMNNSEDPPFDFFPEPFLEEFLVPGGKYYHEDIWSSIYEPGEQAMYANVGFDLISFLVEIISGENFLPYCQEYIFNPLNMHNTSFNLSTLNIENVAIPYHSLYGKYYQINELSFLYGDIFPPQPYWKIRCYPAGGLYTSINDLSHFLIAHMNDGVYKNARILEKETVDLMHDLQEDNVLRYGLAWMGYPISKTQNAMGHGGDIMGVDTWMLYMPSEDIGVIYFANGNPAYTAMSTIGNIAVQALLYSLFKEGGVSMDSSQNVLHYPNSFFPMNNNAFLT